jgi:hypothetical protein
MLTPVRSRRDFAALEARRMQAAQLFQQGHPPATLAQTWRLLGQLGWSRQRPARRAKERDETAIARWMRVRWPQVKKTPNG